MPDYRLTLTFEDDFNGVTQKIIGGNFIDFATADAARAALVTDLQAATGAAITETALAEVTQIASSPTANSSNVFRMSATVNLATTGKRANFQVPAPAASIRAGNSLDPNATWELVLQKFTATGGWEISDGEHIAEPVSGATVSGKVISVRSGPRLLPT